MSTRTATRSTRGSSTLPDVLVDPFLSFYLRTVIKKQFNTYSYDLIENVENGIVL